MRPRSPSVGLSLKPPPLRHRSPAPRQPAVAARQPPQCRRRGPPQGRRAHAGAPAAGMAPHRGRVPGPGRGPEREPAAAQRRSSRQGPTKPPGAASHNIDPYRWSCGCRYFLWWEISSNFPLPTKQVSECNLSIQSSDASVSLFSLLLKSLMNLADQSQNGFYGHKMKDLIICLKDTPAPTAF